MTHLLSQREFIAELDRIGDLQRIGSEVDWNLEIGAVIRRGYDLRAPAPLFTSITGYQDTGFAVLGAPGALASGDHPLARTALSVGLPATATGQEIIEALVSARAKPGIPPVAVPAADAPCKQHVLRGDEIDLATFPIPWIHGNDGGRYVQTYGVNIVKTPDGSWTNWSVNRMMIAGPTTLACLIPPPQQLGIIRSQWSGRGEPMPIALALGVEPGLVFAGGMPLPAGVDESHYVGALFGQPLAVVPAETVDLLVPASAEIVVEGHIAVDETAMEGPMNEFPGYNATEQSPKAVFHVSAITYRDGATLPVVAAGPPVEEDHTIIGTTGAAEIVYSLRQAGLPIASAWCPFEAAAHWLVLAVEPDWHDVLRIDAGELARRVADVLYSGKPGLNTPKTLLVENDIDITDLREVVWAFATRAHPEHGEFHFPNLPSDQLAVYLDEEEAHSFQAGKVIHNCLLADRFPAGRRPVKGSLENGWPPEVRERVLAGWSSYGYGNGGPR